MTITTAAKKLLLDQLIFAPSFLATFILVNNVLQRNSLQTVLQQLRFIKEKCCPRVREVV